MKTKYFHHLVADAVVRCGSAARQVPASLLAAACGVDRATLHRWKAGASVPAGPSGDLAEAILTGWIWLASQEPVPRGTTSHTMATTFGGWQDRRVQTWTTDPTALTLVCLASARPGLLQLIALATQDAAHAADADELRHLNRDPHLESA